MKSIRIVFLIASSVFAQTWTALNSGVTTNVLSSVFFTSPTLGYVGGSGNTMLKTGDGGATWTKLAMNGLDTTIYNLAWYMALYFPSATEGYAAGTISGAGILVKTTDGGGSWTPQTLPADVLLNAFHYRNANRQYACGTSGKILTSTGGSTWTTIYNAPTKQFQGISFGDANTGVAVGFDGDVVRTTDGGTSWNDVTLPTVGSWKGVTFVNPTTAFMVGRKSNLGAILKSTNGGATWTDQVSGTTSQLNAVSFIDANTGYVVGNATSEGTVVLRTTNGGTTWTKGTTPSTLDHLNAVQALSAELVYAAGVSGSILKTGSSTGVEARVPSKNTPGAIRAWTDARGRVLPAPAVAAPGTALPVSGTSR